MEGSRANVLRHMQICRFCLNADENLTNIYDPKLVSKSNSVPLPLQIMACVAIEVFKNDGMPQLICEDCRKLVLQGYSFKANCKKADDALKIFLATGTFMKPINKTDLESYLPQGVGKIRKVLENAPIVAPKKIKIEPDHHHDSDSDMAPVDSHEQGMEQEHALEEYEIRPSANNEYSVKLISSITKEVKNEVKPVKTDCFACSECDRSFPLKQLLDIHMNNHFRQRNHECDECSRSFYSKYDLAKHKLIHATEEEGLFSCVVCKKEFNRRSNLHRHEKIHENSPKYLCCYCSDTFLSKDDLLLHNKRRHDKKRPFSCEQCGKSFVFKQGLERHILVHNEEKPHKCNYCEAAFTSPIKLARHVTSHAGLRPYPCKLCKRTFLLSHHLTRHMRSHYAASSNTMQRIGQHKCDICSMSFRRKDSLINHSAIHSMVNLKCVICYTEFSNAQAVKDHITTHLSGLPFPCEKCDYSFETKDQLEEHEVKHAEMEYEEQIEKEVVEEALAQGRIKETSENENEDFEEFGGDHMGRNDEDDEDYLLDEDECSQSSNFSNSVLNNPTSLRRSARIPKAKKFIDFLKIENEAEEDDDTPLADSATDDKQNHQTADATQDDIQEQPEEVIKPIFRTEGTKVYKRKTLNKKPKVLTTLPSAKPKTAPLSLINQPQVTTIENLGLTTKDLQDLPTEKFVNMKIGNKTVRVQKLVLTKEEMKAMAKQGKIRGNTVLIKNPGHLSSNDPLANSVDENKFAAMMKEATADGGSRNLTKTYNKKKVDESETCNAPVVGKDVVIINDIIVDNIDDSREEYGTNIDLE